MSNEIVAYAAALYLVESMLCNYNANSILDHIHRELERLIETYGEESVREGKSFCEELREEWFDSIQKEWPKWARRTPGT